MERKISLVVLLKGETFKEILLPIKHEISVGRSEESGICLGSFEFRSNWKDGYFAEAYQSVSRTHFILRRYDLPCVENSKAVDSRKTISLISLEKIPGVLTLTDCSRNGTLLNNEYLIKMNETSLRNDDLIEIPLYFSTKTPFYVFRVKIED